jgi:hypothetical protein
MKRVPVRSAGGTPVRIILLDDLDLLFCVPYTMLALATHCALHGISVLVRAVLRPIAGAFTEANGSLTWALVAFPGAVAAAACITSVRGPFSAADDLAAVAVLAWGLIVRVKISLYYEYARSRVRLARPQVGGRRQSRRERAAFDRFHREAASIPGEAVRTTHDKDIIYAAALRTLLFMPAFAIHLLLPPSALRYALIAFIALSTYGVFEPTEHVSAHSKNGALLVAERAPWTWRMLDALRRHVVWGLFGWYPNYYYVTHALHHHVENNGPADWQSTLRYRRSSVLDFCKASTWLGLNFVCPIDTLYYMVQRRRMSIARTLLIGYLSNVALLAAVAWTTPLLFWILLWLRVFGGTRFYAAVGVWHGFHRPDLPQVVEASNHHLAHYIHHRKPRIHLWDWPEMCEAIAKDRTASSMVLLKPEYGAGLGFWALQGLLWSGQLALAGSCFIGYRSVRWSDRATSLDLRAGIEDRGVDASLVDRLVASVVAVSRGPRLAAMDAWLSRVAGHALWRGWRIARARGIGAVPSSHVGQHA